jgi:subtilisin-like proprotein convertase family protein
VDLDSALAVARNHVPDSLGTWTSTGRLVSTGSALPIQDFSTNGAVSRIAVPATVTVIESIVVSVAVLHPRPSDVGIELTNPAGTTKSILLNIGNGLDAVLDARKQTVVLTATIETNAFYGERAEGEWTLKVVDGYEGEFGWLKEWAITVYGH